ncbi:hypothetical protein [Actinoplanes subglobosus]|uniref:Uncharacterized protein n=1 Tax=Actinoplanes subglobosus TaxID=1547892 RepID=A0ABV8J121_9ACTN
MSNAAPARARLSGTRLGRFVALALVPIVAAAIGLSALGLVAPTGYIVLDLVVDNTPFVVLTAVTAGAGIAVAGWLVFRRGPAAIVVRVVTGLLAAVVLAAGVFVAFAKASFATDVLSTEVIAVSPDGGHELVVRETRDWKNSTHHELRLRSRAGLLSRVADTDLADISCVAGFADIGRIRATFTAAREVTFANGAGPDVVVAFDDALRPTTFAAFCP